MALLHLTPLEPCGSYLPDRAHLPATVQADMKAEVHHRASHSSAAKHGWWAKRHSHRPLSISRNSLKLRKVGSQKCRFLLRSGLDEPVLQRSLPSLDQSFYL